MRFVQQAVVVVTAGLVACGGVVTATAAPAGAPAHAHAHPTEGPHHGSLIELGKEDYHAELVHDDKTDTVTIYLLDAAAAKAGPIAAKQLMLNVRAAGAAQQFPLAAQPQADDPEGSASAFAATDKQLCKVLDAKDSSGRLNVEIAGKRYVGRVGGHTHPH